MTDEGKQILAEAIADELQDFGPLEGPADRDLAARCVVDRIEHLLHQRGWMPPETFARIVHWAGQTGSLPEHHVSQSVLTSQLAELAQILHDR